MQQIDRDLSCLHVSPPYTATIEPTGSFDVLLELERLRLISSPPSSAKAPPASGPRVSTINSISVSRNAADVKVRPWWLPAEAASMGIVPGRAPRSSRRGPCRRRRAEG